MVRLALVSFDDKYHLIDILTFLKYVLLWFKEARLEILQNANHELRVRLIFPLKDFNFFLIFLLRSRFFKVKVHLEHI